MGFNSGFKGLKKEKIKTYGGRKETANRFA